METKEIQLRARLLKARAEAILESSKNDEKQDKTIFKKAWNFLDTVFSSDEPLQIWLTYEKNTDYEVSNFGNVRSKKFGKTLDLKPGSNGSYLKVWLWEDGKRLTKFVHQMVAETFHFKADDNMTVHHIDEDKLNNNSDNLTWVTPRQNKQASRKKDSKSIYHGVTSTKSGKWKSQVYHEGKQKHIGVFDNELDAYEAYKLFLKNNNISNPYAL